MWIDTGCFTVLITHSQEASGRDRPRVHWCPVGALGFLPIHAAGVYSQGSLECCSDYVVSSYTSTLLALRRARTELVPMTRYSLYSWPRPPLQARRCRVGIPSGTCALRSVMSPG
jgi:hypothetical protein